MQPHGPQPARLLGLWDFPVKGTGTGCHFLLQGIPLTQGSNLHLLHWQVESLLLSHLGIPGAKVSTNNPFLLVYSGVFYRQILHWREVIWYCLKRLKKFKLTGNVTVQS